jgi:hypothetical protein
MAIHQTDKCSRSATEESDEGAIEAGMELNLTAKVTFSRLAIPLETYTSRRNPQPKAEK